MQNSNTNTMQATKGAIIGKMWVNGNNSMFDTSFTVPQEITLAAQDSKFIYGNTFRVDRNLNTSLVEGEVKPLTLKAGSRLLFYKNDNKRDNNDPDFSVFVVLPEEEANAIIANSKKAVDAWNASHPATS